MYKLKWVPEGAKGKRVRGERDRRKSPGRNTRPNANNS